ncbi:MAG: hypothetical protein HY287_15065 [Planctomycetes bacterium]|nr:hypothetical protein [Planctomycetota bacterium]
MGRGFEHDRLLLDPAEATARALGGRTYREFRIGRGQKDGIVDLLVDWPHLRMVIEAERSAARVLYDVDKARRLQAAVLLIVTSNARASRAIHRKLHRSGVRNRCGGIAIWVKSLGPALQALTNCFSFPTSCSTSNQKVLIPMPSSIEVAAAQRKGPTS